MNTQLFKIASISISFLFLTSCATFFSSSSNKKCERPYFGVFGSCSKPSTDQEVYGTLLEASNSVGTSLTRLGKIEQAANPPVSVKEPPNPNTYGMAIPTSLDWDGPVEPLVQQIANAANYKLKVFGKKPAIPVIISISARDKALGDILRDIGYQSGKQAQIVVFPSSRVIELRYTS